MVTVPNLWPGDTVVCLGGGPSLTPQDVDAVRGRARVIAINDAYRLAPWADVLYACDGKWWKWQYRDRRAEIEAFAGLRYALQQDARRWPGVQVLRNTGESGLELSPHGLRTGRNSGYQAINLAVHLGAARVLLLGYDMSLGQDGRRHWFGDHPDGQRSPYATFQRCFAGVVDQLEDAGVTVVNCSRRTALTCFRRSTIDEALQAREVAA